MSDDREPIETQQPGSGAAGPILAAALLGEFKPCIVYNEHLNMTQMLLEDAPTVWHPWRGTTGLGHAVDLGYHMETGKLIGIKIWDDVRTRPA